MHQAWSYTCTDAAHTHTHRDNKAHAHISAHWTDGQRAGRWTQVPHTVHSCNHITMLLHVPLMDHSSRPAILICVNSKLVTSQTSSLQSPAAVCMYSVTMPSLLPTLHSNSDVSVTIQPPSSVKGCTKHSEGINNVMTVHYSLSIHVHIHHAHTLGCTLAHLLSPALTLGLSLRWTWEVWRPVPQGHALPEPHSHCCCSGTGRYTWSHDRHMTYVQHLSYWECECLVCLMYTCLSSLAHHHMCR